MKLWLLRHAPVMLEAGVCYGATDVSADVALTHLAADAAAALLPQSVAIRVSGLGRAQQLATALRALRPDLPLATIDSRLNEMNFGSWERQPWSAIPREAFDAWMSDFAYHRFGGHESTQEVLERVADALDEQLSMGLPHAVWVTHAGVIRAVRYLAEHGRSTIREAAQWPREAPEPGGMVVLHSFTLEASAGVVARHLVGTALYATERGPQAGCADRPTEWSLPTPGQAGLVGAKAHNRSR